MNTKKNDITTAEKQWRRERVDLAKWMFRFQSRSAAQPHTTWISRGHRLKFKAKRRKKKKAKSNFGILCSRISRNLEDYSLQLSFGIKPGQVHDSHLLHLLGFSVRSTHTKSGGLHQHSRSQIFPQDSVLNDTARKSPPFSFPPSLCLSFPPIND
jgi:hypothetical protein